MNDRKGKSAEGTFLEISVVFSGYRIKQCQDRGA